MQIQILFEDAFQVVAVMDGEDCPTLDWLLDAENSKAKDGLRELLERVAEKGLADVPSAWFHEANKEEKIYEFIKGDLRLFFFKGANNQIAVCTGGVRKKGRKADKAAVRTAALWRAEYIAAVDAGTIEVIQDEDE